MSEASWTLDSEHNLQPIIRERVTRPITFGSKHTCIFPECGEAFLTDEALQLHRLHHDMANLFSLLGEIAEAIVERNSPPGPSASKLLTSVGAPRDAPLRNAQEDTISRLEREMDAEENPS